MTYYPQLYTDLIKSDIKFDLNLSQIHYNNGYIDLDDLEFKQRTIGEHFITNYIKRDYVKSTKEQRKIILLHIEKIYWLSYYFF
jgi:hypothetical protein